MNIKTKFNVNDIVFHKYHSGQKDSMTGFEVHEVLSTTCYGGTQVFYYTRPVIIHKEFEHKYRDEGDFKWIVAHGMSKRDGEMGWNKYREDELIPASKEFLKILKEIKPSV